MYLRLRGPTVVSALCRRRRRLRGSPLPRMITGWELTTAAAIAILSSHVEPFGRASARTVRFSASSNNPFCQRSLLPVVVIIDFKVRLCHNNYNPMNNYAFYLVVAYVTYPNVRATRHLLRCWRPFCFYLVVFLYDFI